MHEFNIIQNIINILQDEKQKHKLQNVSHFVIQIGKLRQIIPETMEFAFSIVAKNTVFEKTKMLIEEIPIKASCQNCGYEFTVINNNFLCPQCKNNSNIISGNEIILTTIEGEQDV